jgi:hypothetical protein
LICIESNAFLACPLYTSITIPRHVQILCSGCFSYCEPLSLISFERDSEFKCIESKAFYFSFLKSITLPYHLQLLCSKSFFDCMLLSSISFQMDSELTRIESNVFSSSRVR